MKKSPAHGETLTQAEILRARKIVRIDPGEWALDLPNDATWADLRQYISPPFSDADDARILTAIRTNIGQLSTDRALVQIGGGLAARLPAYKKMAKHLRAAQKIWDDLGGACSGVPRHLDSLPLLAREAEGYATMKAERGPPVGDAWKHFTRRVAQSFREMGRNPGTTGRIGYDDFEDPKPTWFQEFMLHLNKALPIVLREPTKNDKAFHIVTVRAMKSSR